MALYSCASNSMYIRSADKAPAPAPVMPKIMPLTTAWLISHARFVGWVGFGSSSQFPVPPRSGSHIYLRSRRRVWPPREAPESGPGGESRPNGATPFDLWVQIAKRQCFAKAKSGIYPGLINGISSISKYFTYN